MMCPACGDGTLAIAFGGYQKLTTGDIVRTPYTYRCTKCGWSGYLSNEGGIQSMPVSRDKWEEAVREQPSKTQEGER